ncbi:MAG TPA: hypothetical protein VFP50_02885 [Anaeromyxobacteraceae bacterium]|nr:hypothetical protein [Anaeromyxobacteraceae bacterium]
MRTVIKIVLAAAAVAALVLHPRALAEEPAAAAPAAKDAGPATKEEVRTLTEELRRLKLELGLRDVEYQSYGGLGPAASKVYFAPKGLSIGGYGEMTYTNVRQGADDQSDLLRAVLYVGYRFSDRIVMNSEIEFEHAGKEVAVEFAYLDFLVNDALRVRAGNLLVPMGITNELHEPPFFNGVLRNDVEKNIIPATWSENGVGLHGEYAGLRYQAYLINGLDVQAASAEEPVSAGEWLRRARTLGGEARAQTLAGVLALHYAAGPATVGGSVYHGRAGQGLRTAAGEAVQADVTIAEAHATVAWRGVAAKALYAAGSLTDTALLEQVLPNNPVLGSRVRGGYVEAAYDVLTLATPGSEASLSPFVRYEAYDLNARVAPGFTRDPSVDRSVVTAGLTWKPLSTVALKADWQRRDSRAAGSQTQQVNLGAGFAF